MKVKTSELTGIALDWAVAVCEGMKPFIVCKTDVAASHKDLMVGLGEADKVKFLSTIKPRIYVNEDRLSTIPMYHRNWEHGGPIVEQRLNNLFKHNPLRPEDPDVWCGCIHIPSAHGVMLLNICGPTPLVAAMRTYVASKLGDEIEVPDELVNL